MFWSFNSIVLKYLALLFSYCFNSFQKPRFPCLISGLYEFWIRLVFLNLLCCKPGYSYRETGCLSLQPTCFRYDDIYANINSIIIQYLLNTTNELLTFLPVR